MSAIIVIKKGMHYLRFTAKVDFLFWSGRTMEKHILQDISGFNPIVDKDAQILILGSMPSEVSISKQEYYAHQRNAFWPIMLNLLDAVSDSETSMYYQRKKMLIKHHIAVWDVLKSCFRTGSLDTAIQMNSIQTNDFMSFFSLYPKIKRVFFNGSKAEIIYLKYVLPQIKEQFSYLKYQRLPSTSPAHASISFQQKLKAWKNAINYDHV